MSRTTTRHAAFTLAFLCAAASQAAIITVTTTLDENGAGGSGCALREAILSANNDAAIGGCSAGSGADTINLPAGIYHLALAGSDDAGFFGDLDIHSQLTLLGADPAPGNGSVTVIIDANALDRVLEVHPGIVVELRRLLLRGGSAAAANGGGIRNQGELTLVEVIVEGNRADGSNGARVASGLGGGIANEGSLTVERSLIFNNRAQGGRGTAGVDGGGGGGGGGGLGGGLFNAAGATVTLINVTFADNIAAGGRGGDGSGCPEGGLCADGPGGDGGGDGGSHGDDAAGGNLGGGGGGGDASAVFDTGGVGGSGGIGGGGGGGGGGGILFAPPGAGGSAGFGGGAGASGDFDDGGAGGGGGGIGGGIANLGIALLRNCTLTGNRAFGGSAGTSAADAPGGGGIGVGGGAFSLIGSDLRLSNTITFGNTADSGADCRSLIIAITSLGHNLVGTGGGCPVVATGDQATTDALLGPLTANGGPTSTRALLNGSPAIDAGSPEPPGTSTTACAATDQRGVARPQGTRCDIGAFEAGRPDVAVSKAAPASAAAGASLTYTLTVANVGGADAANVTVTDLLPAELTVISLPPPCSGTATVVCPLGTLGAGQTVVLTLNLRLDPGATASAITNSATVASNPADLNTANNSASATTAVRREVDLALTKSATPPSVVAGSPLTYTLTATNNGPSNAAGVVIIDTLPAQVTVLAAPGCTAAGSTVTCALGTLTAGAAVARAIDVAVAEAAAGALTNTASVSSATTELNAANNTAVLTTTVVPRADLAITKTDGVILATPGGSLTYTIAVTNNGPSPVSDARVTDLLPAALSCFWGCTGAGGAVCRPGQVAGSIVSEPVNLPVGAVATFTAACTIAPTATGTLANTATVAVPATVFDPISFNNAASDHDTVLAPRADLVLTKTNAPSSVPRGGTLVYTLEVENLGPSTATGVVISDVLPAGVIAAVFPPRTAGTLIFADGFESGDTSAWTQTVGTMTNPCSVSGHLATCTVGALASGSRRTFQLTVTVGFSASGTLTNTATVASSSGDPNTGNNTATAQAAVVTAPIDLALTLTDAPDPTSPGGLITYTATITNAGPATATGVVFDDPLPPELALLSVSSSQGSCTPGAEVSCQLGTLRPVDVATVTITARVAGSASGALTNAASVTGAETEFDFGDNTATAVTGIARLKETP